MNRLKLAAFILILHASAQAQQQGSFEQKMHDIYKTSYSEEINDERWASYLAGIGNRTYQVREGDTLWDLSVIFFGDGLFWSKIWSYNEKLTNPHSINVGQKIAFFTGSVEEPPGVNVDQETGGQTQAEEQTPFGLPAGFTVVETEPTAETLSEEDQEAQSDTASDVSGGVSKVQAIRPSVRSSLYPGAPSIPPPRKLVRPVLKTIPTTFANSDAYNTTKYDHKGISFDLRPPVRVNPLFVAQSFLYGRSIQHYPKVGKLLESENHARLVGLNQMVYLKSEEKLSIGEIFTIMGRKYDFDRNGAKGDVIEYQGMVEITEAMPDKIYRGRVVKSLAGIKGSPWISREPIPTFTDDYVGRPNNLKLQVIGGGADNVSRFFGQGEVVFLNGGSNKGVRVGDIFAIYKRRDIRYKDTDITRSPVPIGHIKVFRSEPKLASAFVISSDDVIVPGDETGAPTIVEAVATASEREDLDAIETGLDFNTDSPQPEETATDLEQELSEFE